MRRTSNAQVIDVPVETAEEAPCALADDARWVLAQRVVAGPHFARSPLLSKFLLYVVRETVEGRQATITEHRLGVAVFGRPQSYRTDEDNIVRNYARQLRRRLTDHFENEGSGEPMRIAVPVGTYVPTFVEAPSPAAGKDTEQDGDAHRLRTSGETSTLRAWFTRVTGRHLPVVFLATVLGLAMLTAAWTVGSHMLVPSAPADPTRILWHAILPDSGETFIVPPDAGFNLMEDMSERSVSLAGYISRWYEDLPPAAVNPHTRQDLRSAQYTDFATLQIVAMLAHRPEYDTRRVQLRFPRDLRIDDLKNGNAILIGSATANPWASLADSRTNFRIVTGDDMEGATILNAHPLSGEQSRYASHWNEPAHDTYALILYQPNLSGRGHLLSIEGLDVAGTQAASELLFHPEALRGTLGRATRRDGSLRPFEVLVRATSIQSDAEGTQIIAERVE